MSDAIPSKESGQPTEKIVEVKHSRQIPLLKGDFFFNSGHADLLREDYPPAFENNASTIYKVKGKNEDGIDGAAVVNLKTISGSLLVYTENFMEPLMDTMHNQLRSGIYAAQATQLLLEARQKSKEARRLIKPRDLSYYKLARSRRILLQNSDSVEDFLNAIDSRGIKSEGVEKFRSEIKESIEMARKMFGKGSSGKATEFVYKNKYFTKSESEK